MASGNSSNANRYKGEDIDTDGDGSVNDSQTLQGNQPSDLANTIDNNTITKNQDGDLFVPFPFKINFLDLESSQGTWNKFTNTDTGATASVNFSTGIVKFEVTGGDSFNGANAGIESSKDLSDVDNITVTIDSATEVNKAEVSIKLNNNTKFLKNARDISDNTNVSIDTSTFGKNTNIKLQITVQGFNNEGTATFSNIESATKNLPLTTKFRGAGE